MRIRSAYFTLLLAMGAGTAITLVACRPDATAPVATAESGRSDLERKLEEFQAIHGWVGDYHTRGLEFVYNRLAESAAKPQREKDVCKAMAKAIKEFHLADRKAALPLGFVDVSLATEVCPENGSEGHDGEAVALSGNVLMSSQELPSLTASYLDQIITAVHSATSRAALLNALLSIQYSAILSLPPDEVGIVVQVASIAITSADYWDENLDAWLELGGPAVRYSQGVSMDGVGQPLSSVPIRVVMSWWKRPAVQKFQKIIQADATAAIKTYLMGRVTGVKQSNEAIAAQALWGSASAAAQLTK